MKFFLLNLILIFSFQSIVKANNVSDFEIEGISVQDSLLNYYSEEKIINSHKTIFPNSCSL